MVFPRYLPCYVLLFALLLGCSQEENIPLPSENFLSKQVSLADMAIGQRSRHIVFKGFDYLNEDSIYNYSYSKDTLILEVSDFDGEWFILKEYLASGSAILKNPTESLLPDGDTDTAFVKARVNGDYLDLGRMGHSYGGRLLYTFLADSIPLPPIISNSVDYSGWFFPLPKGVYSTFYGHDPMYQQGGVNFLYTNVIVRNEAMAADGPGLTMVYEPGGMLIRVLQTNYWVTYGLGYDLMVDN